MILNLGEIQGKTQRKKHLIYYNQSAKNQGLKKLNKSRKKKKIVERKKEI